MNQSEDRIGLHDTLFEIMYNMSDSNPLALSILTDLLEQNPAIDPDDCFGGMGTIVDLDTLGIYGSDICSLYKICDNNISALIGVLRAWQLGVVSGDAIMQAVLGHKTLSSTDIEAMIQQVRDTLPQLLKGDFKHNTRGTKNDTKTGECSTYC